MIVTLGLILLAGLYAAFIFNRAIRLKMLLAEALSGIDVQLKRRHDLIPNIVEAVKGYMRYEAAVLEQVTLLRNQAMKMDTVQDKARAENRLSSALKHVFALAENYPDLKANKSFLGLQSALIEVEDELQMSRRYYNGTVRNYNILIQSFPNNMVLSMFGFASASFFEIEYATQRQNPDVKFS